MKVLIASFDLFRLIGGGQTFYRGLVLRNPGADFYYFRARESVDHPLPPNAHPIPYVERYDPSSLADAEMAGLPPWLRQRFVEASNMAFSARGHSFDVVDAPDFLVFCGMLRPALRRQGVGVGKVALSMHGRTSTAVSLGWSANVGCVPSILQAEVAHYAAADVRYCISEMYRDEWRALRDLPTRYIDPMWFFSFGGPRPYAGARRPPDLNLIGRMERLKGPHVFLELLWRLDPSCYHEANLIGPEHSEPDGTRSSDYLRSMAANRRLNVNHLRCMTPAGLARLFASKSMTVLPSLYDTLNLVALESLLSGCPTAVGDGAGVCRYLRDRYPRLPFVTIPMDRPLASVPLIENVLRDYDAYRAELAARLAEIDKRPAGPGVEAAYAARPEFDSEARNQFDDMDRRMHRRLRSRRAAA